jgi:branched-chain amino acid transport system ATP-binding protein
LIKKRDIPAHSLTIVDRKRLGLASALATKPKLLLLDEAVAGLNPAEIDEIIGLLKRIRESGVTLFVVEHVMRFIMSIADRIIVLHHGEKIAEGKPKEIAEDERVIEAYLGERYA